MTRQKRAKTRRRDDSVTWRKHGAADKRDMMREERRHWNMLGGREREREKAEDGEETRGER